jgi:eukaryotic-like serine/threonine-protein kinase
MHVLPTPGTLVSDKYRIEALLGEGSMGAVFRAHHEMLSKHVALKWLRPELAQQPEARDRFLREARAASRIHHPNVVEIYDVGVYEDGLFLVMELLHGESFEQTIQRLDVRLSTGLRLLVGAMHGVAAAHRRGIVHRDIKPENIFVVRDEAHPEGIAKVLDFSISKLLDDLQPSTTVTQTGHAMGTPLYMSIEQMNGARDVDHRTDIYAFGVLLYRILTGELPFEGPTLAAIAIKLATHYPPTPNQLRPELPTALDAVVMKAITRERELRYQTMDELIEALMRVCIEEGLLPPTAAHGTSHDTPSAPLALASLDRLRTLRTSARATAPRASIGLSAGPGARILLPVLGLLAIAAGTFTAWSAGPQAGPLATTPPKPVAEPERLPAAAAVVPAKVAAPVVVMPVNRLPPARKPASYHLPDAATPLAPRDGEPLRPRESEPPSSAPGPTATPPAPLAPPPPAIVVPSPQTSADKLPRTATGRRSGTLSLEDLTD